jgi:hypothetical protein
MPDPKVPAKNGFVSQNVLPEPRKASARRRGQRRGGLGHDWQVKTQNERYLTQADVSHARHEESNPP